MSGVLALEHRVTQPGRNCWSVERAHRFRVVQDGADYFRLVRGALLEARHTVFILGWDMTAGIDLLPGAPTSGAPTRFDKVIAYIAQRRPQLRCYILTWNYGLLFALERDPFSRWRFGWRMPPGVRFDFDDRHPVGGCHHQKIVVVDDHLAFCGGMDLTGHRWDTSAHRPDEPARKTQLGAAYDPYHEVQAMAEGPVAARLGALARDRWRALGVEQLPPIGSSTDSLWPSDLPADFTDVDVAIARTVPPSGSQPAIRECEAQYLDAIALAKRTIYIENQYFTNTTLADALAQRLAETDGPEALIVMPRRGDGWLEKHTIELLRDRVFRRLVAADAHDRLRLVFPMASRARDVATFIHSKVLIVDDDLVRVGSANATHRSMGVDTECDVTVEAAGNPDMRVAIRRIRGRLIAEHLALPPDTVTRLIDRMGSLRAVVDAQQGADHTLVRFEVPTADVPEPPALVQAAVDPDEPMASGLSFAHLVPPFDVTEGRALRHLWIVPAGAAAAAVVVVWIWSGSIVQTQFPDVQQALIAIRSTSASVVVGVSVVFAAGVMMAPLELLAIAAGLLLGWFPGGVVVLAGSLGVATVGYVAGRMIGPTTLGRWMNRRTYRAVRQLGGRGVVGIAVLRLAAVGRASAIHLLLGAGRVPFGRYLSGTAIGLVPPIAVLSGFGALLGRALVQPSVSNTVITVVGGLLLLVFSLARHREPAGLG